MAASGRLLCIILGVADQTFAPLAFSRRCALARRSIVLNEITDYARLKKVNIADPVLAYRLGIVC